MKVGTIVAALGTLAVTLARTLVVLTVLVGAFFAMTLFAAALGRCPP